MSQCKQAIKDIQQALAHLFASQKRSSSEGARDPNEDSNATKRLKRNSGIAREMSPMSDEEDDKPIGARKATHDKESEDEKPLNDRKRVVTLEITDDEDDKTIIR